MCSLCRSALKLFVVSGLAKAMFLLPKPISNPLELRTRIDGMLRRTTQRRYRTAFDCNMKGVYGQIRVVPERVEKSTVATPAMYRALINCFLASYIRRSTSMDIYLDDIAIYSDNLSRSRLHFTQPALTLLRRLGRLIEDQGVRIDPRFSLY